MVVYPTTIPGIAHSIRRKTAMIQLSRLQAEVVEHAIHFFGHNRLPIDNKQGNVSFFLKILFLDGQADRLFLPSKVGRFRQLSLGNRL